MIRVAGVEPGSALFLAMLALRTRVLRAPLGLAYSDEQLAEEDRQLHFALQRDATVVGTLLAVPPDRSGTAKLRQMAIEPSFERHGYGRALVQHAEYVLASMGATAIVLAARASAIGFYGTLGYAAYGESFTEVTLPHRMMRKRLRLS